WQPQNAHVLHSHHISPPVSQHTVARSVHTTGYHHSCHCCDSAGSRPLHSRKEPRRGVHCHSVDPQRRGCVSPWGTSPEPPAPPGCRCPPLRSPSPTFAARSCPLPA